MTYKEMLQFALVVWHYPLAQIDNVPITIGGLVLGIVFLGVGFFASSIGSKKISKASGRRFHLGAAAVSTVQTLAYYALLAFFAIFALKIANIPLTAFTVIGGALAIGVGFGSQNIVQNFISGIILMIERPIQLGDTIEIEGLTGTVEFIGMRSTQLLLGDNSTLILPNSSFLEKHVINWTHRNQTIRLTVNVGVAYGSDIKLVKSMIEKCISGDERVLQTPKPMILLVDFGDNALQFRTNFWIPIDRLIERGTIESDFRSRLAWLFAENKISMPFPQRDIHIEKPIEVLVKSPART